MCREKNFSAVQEHCPPEKNRSPFVAFPTADLPTLRLAENSFVDAPKKRVRKQRLEGVDTRKRAR
jgi:hypothetical protein